MAGLRAEMETGDHGRIRRIWQGSWVESMHLFGSWPCLQGFMFLFGVQAFRSQSYGNSALGQGWESTTGNRLPQILLRKLRCLWEHYWSWSATASANSVLSQINDAAREQNVRNSFLWRQMALSSRFWLKCFLELIQRRILEIPVSLVELR
jgi:hypothetical protein